MKNRKRLRQKHFADSGITSLEIQQPLECIPNFRPVREHTYLLQKTRFNNGLHKTHLCIRFLFSNKNICAQTIYKLLKKIFSETYAESVRYDGAKDTQHVRAHTMLYCRTENTNHINVAIQPIKGLKTKPPRLVHSAEHFRKKTFETVVAMHRTKKSRSLTHAIFALQFLINQIQSST